MTAPKSLHDALDAYWRSLSERKANGEFAIRWRLVGGKVIGKAEYEAREVGAFDSTR